MSTLRDLAQASVGSSNSLQPRHVEGPTYSGVSHVGKSYFARRDFLVDAYRDWHDRVEKVTMITNGEWWRVWPDLTREPTAPSVANIIELAIAHAGAVGGAVVPSVSVPVPYATKGPEGERGARKRERRIRELREKSNMPNLLSLLWQDYAGAGACAVGVWADFSEKDPAKRNPRYIRFDPRHYFPVKDSNGRITELLVARKRSIYDLQREYPSLPQDALTSDDEVEEWFWYTKDEFLHAVVDMPTNEPKKRNMVVLGRVKNDLGRVPVVEIQRPSFDGERRGEFDQTIHILRTMHQLMYLTVERTAEEVYPTIAGFDVDKLETFGPGATMQYRSAEGKVDVFQPQQHFDVKDLIARLEENARTAARYPQQLSGEPGASIASGRAISQSMGALDASLALIHRQFEWGLAIADGMALQFDEIFCDGEKTIYGDARDRKNPETFVPSRDIDGHYEVNVSYGLGAGSDPANRELRLQMFLNSRLVSRKRAREELDFLEDPEEQEVEMAKEMMLDATIAGLIQKSQTGESTLSVEFLKMLNDPKTTLEEKVEKLLEKLKAEEEQRQQQMQGGGLPPAEGPGGAGGVPPGLQPAVAAESLARGGIPGNAEGLPPLPSVLGPSAPRQVA